MLERLLDALSVLPRRQKFDSSTELFRRSCSRCDADESLPKGHARVERPVVGHKWRMRQVGIPAASVHCLYPGIEFRLVILVPPQFGVPELFEGRPCAGYVGGKASDAVNDVRELSSLILKPELRWANSPFRGKDRQD